MAFTYRITTKPDYLHYEVECDDISISSDKWLLLEKTIHIPATSNWNITSDKCVVVAAFPIADVESCIMMVKEYADAVS